MRGLLLSAAVASLAGCSGGRPVADASDGLLTRAEATRFEETSRYEDVVAFLDEAAQSDGLHLTSFGETMEGRELPLVVWGASSTAPQAIRATGKTRILAFANIHAGEVAGKEALQILVRRLAEGRHAAWADSLVLLIAPIYNADGNERMGYDNRPLQHGPIGGMGQRSNAQGLDLNRDFMKLVAPESRALVGLIRDYDPHLVLDLHTTNGTLHAYHLTYAPPLNPNTPPEIDSELRERLLPVVTDRIRRADGRRVYHYGNVPPADAGVQRGWYSFDARPRFSTNYMGVRNRFGVLSEAYSYATFEERVLATLRFVEEVISYAHWNAATLRTLTAQADARPVVGDSLSLRATWDALPAAQEILLGGVDSVYHPVTGRIMLERTTTVRPERMPAFIRFRPVEQERAPAAYLVPPDLAGVVDLLDLHGIEYYRAVAPSPVEVFAVDSVRVANEPFQGRAAQTLFGRYGTLDDAAPMPVMVVPVDQPLGRLAFMLLEPRSDDGIVAWAVLPEAVYTARREYPIRRIHGSLPAR